MKGLFSFGISASSSVRPRSFNFAHLPADAQYSPILARMKGRSQHTAHFTDHPYCRGAYPASSKVHTAHGQPAARAQRTLPAGRRKPATQQSRRMQPSRRENRSRSARLDVGAAGLTQRTGPPAAGGRGPGHGPPSRRPPPRSLARARSDQIRVGSWGPLPPSRHPGHRHTAPPPGGGPAAAL